MARLARVIAAGLPHHVTQRGNARRFILRPLRGQAFEGTGPLRGQAFEGTDGPLRGQTGMILAFEGTDGNDPQAFEGTDGNDPKANSVICGEPRGPDLPFFRLQIT